MPTGVRQEAFLGEGSWVKTIGNWQGLWQTEEHTVLSQRGVPAPAPAIVARWECRFRVTSSSDSSGESVELDFP